jgi:hypothetical protein
MRSVAAVASDPNDASSTDSKCNRHCSADLGDLQVFDILHS